MAELNGKTVCFTGTLKTQTRAQASAEAKKHGAKVINSITGKLEILIVGLDAGSKLKKAEEKGIEVWTEEHFNDVTGLSGGTKKDASSTAKAASKKRAKSEPEDAPTPKKAKKKTAPKTKATPVKKPAAKKMAPATPAKPGSAGERNVMSAVSNPEGYSVYQDYDVKLMLSDSLNANSNKFYKLQLLQDKGGNFFVATNWGRLGEHGQSQLKGPHEEQKAVSEFSKVFRSKTKNPWGADPFVRHDGKYQIVETTTEDGGDNSDALGRLTEAQIKKGQEVLKQIRAILEPPKAEGVIKRRRKNPKDDTQLGVLTNEFYSLIPTTSGRQQPPKLDNTEIVTEKEGLLEFWLRMGFEEISDSKLDGSPIEGVFKLPVPVTLSSAASKIADKHSITESQKRATSLAKTQAGTPSKTMSKELYAAILLYTGNSIYRELNRCLRLEWKSVPKYWNYLRLYFEAAEHMPTREVTLWRGIAADLFDEYEEGKIITWWTISSCTADKSVAENFMNQLGGSAATLLTLHTKTACDISSLSFYPHEAESLLKPGTKLKVLSRKRNGKVSEIEVEEVLEEETDVKEGGKTKEAEGMEESGETDVKEDEEMEEAEGTEESGEATVKEDEEMKEPAKEKKQKSEPTKKDDQTVEATTEEVKDTNDTKPVRATRRSARQASNRNLVESVASVKPPPKTKPSKKAPSKKATPENIDSSQEGTVDTESNIEGSIEQLGGEPCDVMLCLVDPAKNIDKFYVIQLIQRPKGQYSVYTRWGRTGTVGQSKQDDFGGLAAATKIFKKKFKDKSGLAWEKRTEPIVGGKYRFVQQDFAQKKQGYSSAKWQYWVDDGVDGKPDGWYDYDTNGSVRVEKLFAEHSRNPDLSNRTIASGAFTYAVDLVNMTQTNVTHSNHTSRRIRRHTEG